MATNDWQIGALYIHGGPGGFWTQPGGVGSLVYPRQVQANSDLFTTEPFTELTGQYIFGCGHSQNSGTIWVDVDKTDGESVALITCCLCSYVQRFIKPASAALTGSTPQSLASAILYP